MSQSQIRCGMLKKTGSGFSGSIRLIGRLAGDLELKPHELRGKTENSPAFEVFFRDNTGTVFPIGSAWMKNSDNVNGGDFLSLTMIHPDWEDDLSLAAFPADNGEFRLTYSRPRGARVQQVADAA